MAGWTSAASMPQARKSHAATSYGSTVYVLGGLTVGGTELDSLIRYDPGANAWTTLAPVPGGTRTLHTLTAVGGYLYAVGGLSLGQYYLSENRRFNPATNAWTRLADFPELRAGHAAASVAGKLYVFGGQSSSGTYRSDTHVYDPGTNAWTALASMPGVKSGGACAVVGGLVYVVGGRTGGSTFSAATYAYDPVANTWATLAPLPATLSHPTATAGTDGKVYVFGGQLTPGGARSADVYAYDPALDTWTLVAPMPAGGRDAAAAAAIGSTSYVTGGETTSGTIATVEVYTLNRAPNAPTLTAPADGVTIDLGSTQRFDWDFSDPDTGDTQSQYELRYKVTTDATWTTLTGSTPNTYRDVTSGTFTSGDYEWQVRTWDALGLAGPWSPSSFFTAAIPTGVPTITDPLSGGTVSTNPYTVAWSTAGGQDAYQIRRVADNAGAADGTTVYYDTGQVNSTTARSASVPFETNNRFEHIQVRIYLAGLWSSWASIRVNVSYTGPEAPTVSTATDAVGGALHITTSNPTPGAGVPATNYNDIYIRETTGPANTVVRVATLQTPNTTTTWRGPASGVDYEVQVVAFGDNGTTAASAWTGASVPMSTEYYGGGY